MQLRCLGGASNWTNVRVHFVHRHARETTVILEEGNRPYPRCPQCEMCVSHKALDVRHTTTTFYQQGEKRNWRRLAEEGATEGAETAITAYGIPLSPVTSFNYLGNITMTANNEWPAVVSNMWKSR